MIHRSWGVGGTRFVEVYRRGTSLLCRRLWIEDLLFFNGGGLLLCGRLLFFFLVFDMWGLGWHFVVFSTREDAGG